MAGHDYIDVNSTWVHPADRKKVSSWRRNYDATWEPSGKLVKGAVDDFFDCNAEVQHEQVTSLGSEDHCDHKRPVTVASNHRVTWGNQDVSPPTWAVLK
jgi:hypothetical protein